MKKHNRNILLLSVIFLTVYMACLFLPATPILGIRYNISPSLPYKYFLSLPFRKPARNQYVLFSHPRSPIPLVKQLVGLPGDTISYQDNHIFVDGKDFGALLQLTPTSQGKIPEGYVFVHAPHEESFDSRYQEFGLVPVTNLEEVLWPIY